MNEILKELTDFAIEIGGGMDIHFAGHNSVIFEDVAYPWQCIVGSSKGVICQAYGTTFEDAVLGCYRRWKEGLQGYMNGVADVEKVSLGNWFDYQQNKVWVMGVGGTVEVLFKARVPNS